jgi:hypothetical protein
VIEKMNQSKIGAPFQYTDSQIDSLAGIKIAFGIPYRIVQGVCSEMSEFVKIPEIHFTHIRRRIIKLQPKISGVNLDDTVDLVFDSTGLSTTNSGTYLEHK